MRESGLRRTKIGGVSSKPARTSQGERDSPSTRLATLSRYCQPDEIDDPPANILRVGLRQLLAQAVEVEVATVKDLKLAEGRARVVRHGYGPARTIAIDWARSRWRGLTFATAEQPAMASGSGSALRSCRYGYGRRTKSLDTLLPVLYLRGNLDRHLFSPSCR